MMTIDTTNMCSHLQKKLFLIAAKLIHLIPDVVFKALDILFIRPAVDNVEKYA